SMPFSIILSKDRIDPVCNRPQRIVCSPIKSDFTSATKEERNTPALCPPVPTQYAFASISPFPCGSFSGCTAIKVGTPNPRQYSALTSLPGHLGATIITVRSFRICIPSSTILKPCEYDNVAPCFINGITALITEVCCLSGVKLITKSAVGINSSYVPTVNFLYVAFFQESLFCSIASLRKA